MKVRFVVVKEVNKKGQKKKVVKDSSVEVNLTRDQIIKNAEAAKIIILGEIKRKYYDWKIVGFVPEGLPAFLPQGVDAAQALGLLNNANSQ